MSREKLRLANTDLGNLIGNLRGEVGEVITTWLLMRQFIGRRARLRTGDMERDLANREIDFLSLLIHKLGDELIGRLSELAEKKFGQLTFYFAAKKLGQLEGEVASFEAFVIKHRIRDKRNRDVSHKHLPEKAAGRNDIQIQYPVMVRAVAMALRLMKRIDRRVLGPSSPYSWREARKRRYDYISPPRVGYLLIPYLHLSGDDRIRILEEELREATNVWSQMPTTIDGQPATVMACQKWGIIALGDRLLALDQYPLQELTSLQTEPRNQPTGGASSHSVDTPSP